MNTTLTKPKTETKYILSYGTLRCGAANGTVNPDRIYNWQRFGGQKYIKTLKIKGFSIYDLGYYPCAVESNEEIIVELQEVENQAFENIQGMELSAGYEEKLITVDDSIQASIFVMDKKGCTNLSKITSGDWLEN